jgi:hypothetical protein
MARWKRVLIGLGLAILATGAYAWFFGPQTMFAVLTRYQYRKIPVAYKTPVALADVTVSSTSHPKIAWRGYEVELPWDDVDDKKSRIIGAIHFTAFSSGDGFWFSVFGPKEFVKGVLDSTKIRPEIFRSAYGDAASQSDYVFYRKMLETTPASITPFMPRKEAANRSILLLIKAIAAPAGDSGIFDIQAPGFQGFQFENPQSQPRRVVDDLYAEDGGIELIFFQDRKSAPKISQPEINRILQSIHKVPAGDSVPSAPSGN